MSRREYALHISVIAAVSLTLMGRQFFQPAVYSCVMDDTIWYLNWTRQFADSILHGVWYPRWMPDSHCGYGNPTFIFYSPLVVCLTALLDITTSDIYLSVSLVKLAGLFLSGLFMYIFMKDLYGGAAGLTAALVYIALPFRVFDLYFLGVYSSKFAFVWFPVILYYARKAIAENNTGAGIAGLAASYALLCLTHLLSAYMFLPVLFVFGMVSAGRGRLKTAAFRVLVACLLGLSLSAFFLLPVLMEYPLVHFDSFAKKPWAQYWNNYLFFISKPISPYNPHFYPYLARTVMASVLAGLSVYLLSRPFKDKRERPYAAFFVFMVVATLFLMSSLSGPLWGHVPGLKMVMFPTRWAAVTVFGLACIAGAGAGHIRTHGRGFRQTLVGFWGVVFIAAASHALYYDTDIMRKGCALTGQELLKFPDGYDVQEYVPRNVSLEWLTAVWERQPDPKITPQDPGNNVTLDIKAWDPLDRAFTVKADGDATLRVRTFYYPGWHAAVDGRDAPIAIEDTSGAMLLKVPKGGHDVRLTFSDTPARKAGKVISAIALVFALYLFARPYLKARGFKPHRRAC